MRKLILFLLLIPFFAHSQSWVTGTIQKLSTSDSIRYFQGSNIIPLATYSDLPSVPSGLTDSLLKKANRDFSNVASGVIPNSKLANSTISGIALGSNLNALTNGYGLSAGGTYNGGTARTFAVDTTLIRTVANSVSLSGLQTRLNSYLPLTGGTLTGTLTGTTGAFTTAVNAGAMVSSYKISLSDTSSYIYTSTGAANSAANLSTQTSQIIRNTSNVTGSGAFLAFRPTAISRSQDAYIGAISVGAGYTPIMVFGQRTGNNAYAEAMRLTEAQVLQVNSLAGTGTRMVVANSFGALSTQAIPSGGGGGSVTNVGIASANGFAGTSDGDPDNPTLTLSTTISGILQGNGTAISAASTTGSGNIVLDTSPTLTTPNLGTPSAITLTNATGLPVSSGITGLGTGVATALAVNTGSSGSFVVNGGALGTPSSGTLTNATGLPVSSGISGLGTNVATWLATPTSANLRDAVTGETGTGGLVFATSPTLVTPNLGTPTSVTLTNATGLPVSTGISGLGTGVATALAVNTGSSGSFITYNGNAGTPSALVGTNITGTASALNIGGNAGTATKLQTARTINGVSFDGSANINIGTTVGQSLIGLTNPSAIRFIRINADNTVSALSASDFRTAIGAGTGAGTVTSVSAGNGLNFTTITGSGDVTLGTPSSITASSTNSVSTNSHTHAIVSLPSAVTATTQSANDNSTKIATTAYADAKVVNNLTSSTTIAPSKAAVISALSGKANESIIIATSAPLSGGGDLSSNRTLSISQANTSTSGYLTSTDWNTFNNKASTASVALKADIASPTFTGTVTIPDGSALGTPSALVGTNITGTASALNIGGNAGTATKLATARNIQGVSFDGTANINIINGTGFVKASGTTLSYDNTSYLPLSGGTLTGTLTGTTGAFTTAVNAGAMVSSYKISLSDTSSYIYTSTGAANSAANLSPQTSQIIRNTSDVTGSGAFLAFRPTAISRSQDAYIGAISVGAGYTPIMVFGQRTGNNAYAESMRLNNNRNLQLGSATATSGDEKLQVTGSASISSTLSLPNVPTGTAGTDSIVVLKSDNTLGRIAGSSYLATSSLGTGVATALGTNVGSAGAFITYNGNAGTPSALVGTNITGTASALSIGGNAGTATKLATARTIAGVSFDGTANISLNNNAITNGAGYITSAALSPYTPISSFKQIYNKWNTTTTEGLTTEVELAGANIDSSLISNVGDRIDFEFSGSFVSNANDKYIRMYIGGDVIQVTGNASNKAFWSTGGYFIRTSSSECKLYIQTWVDDSMFNSVIDVDVSAFNPLTFSVTGQSTSTTAYAALHIGYLDYRPAP